MPIDSNTAYQQLSKSEVKSILKRLEVIIDDFLNRGLQYDHKIKYTVCAMDLIDVILRVDKRIHYFQVFHGMDCNEGKKAALYAYWIVKLRPIMITDPRYINTDGYNNKINEFFAIHYMLCALDGMGRINHWNGNTGINLTLNNPFVQRMWYAFRFRNITIDSIIVLADAITTDTFRQSEQDVLP